MKNLIVLAITQTIILCLLSCNSLDPGKDASNPSRYNSEKPSLTGWDSLIPAHVSSKDIDILSEAFLHGYTHNIVYETVSDKNIPTLTIQCTSGNVHSTGENLQPGRPYFSVWTRDLYWGFLGWSHAGDCRVLEMMKSSIVLLIEAKNRNQALGQSKLWPLNDSRYYIPQAYTKGLKSALDFYPWCSESQVDFLLLCYNYWQQTGDVDFIQSIWNDILYVTETVEKLDTDGNSLPDALQGSYDYMWIKEDSEEPLMCAKTSLAYACVAEMAKLSGEKEYSSRLLKLSEQVKETMNKAIDSGGLWKESSEGGYYVQMRKIGEKDSIHGLFIPYNNLVPMWCKMTNAEQDEEIFHYLDTHFEKYYELEYGPIYCAPAGKNEESVMDCSSVTWLAFLDVYLRGKKGHIQNRSKIYEMLMKHSGDAGGIPFPEGAGVYGNLTGGAGRSWDNGNFFHMLIEGIYGLHKDRNGIKISLPNPVESFPVTELLDMHWRNAVYNFHYKGEGKEIRKVKVNGRKVRKMNGEYLLAYDSGTFDVEIFLK